MSATAMSATAMSATAMFATAMFAMLDAAAGTVLKMFAAFLLVSPVGMFRLGVHVVSVGIIFAFVHGGLVVIIMGRDIAPV